MIEISCYRFRRKAMSEVTRLSEKCPINTRPCDTAQSNSKSLLGVRLSRVWDAQPWVISSGRGDHQANDKTIQAKSFCEDQDPH